MTKKLDRNKILVMVSGSEKLMSWKFAKIAILQNFVLLILLRRRTLPVHTRLTQQLDHQNP